MQGLQQAFHTAGVRTVIGSLWRVDDAATAVLMEEFYTNLWQMKLPKLEALRQAQLTILHHPERVEQRRQFLASTERALGKVSRPLPKADEKAPTAAANRRGGPPSSSAATFAEHHDAHAPSGRCGSVGRDGKGDLSAEPEVRSRRGRSRTSARPGGAPGFDSRPLFWCEFFLAGLSPGIGYSLKEAIGPRETVHRGSLSVRPQLACLRELGYRTLSPYIWIR